MADHPDRMRLQPFAGDGGVEMVTVGEMINYLMDHDFKDDQEICFLVGDPQKRLVWHPEKLMGITDQHRPIILLEVGDPEPMDEEEKQ